VAERILKLKAPLMQTVVSQEWADWVSRGAAKVKDEAAEVKAFLLNEKEFWPKLEIMTAVFQPVVDLLGLTDSLVPAASKVSTLCLQRPSTPELVGGLNTILFKVVRLLDS
jgi:hypothetical protein